MHFGKNIWYEDDITDEEENARIRTKPSFIIDTADEDNDNATHSAFFSPDGSKLVVTTLHQGVSVYAVPTYSLLKQITHSSTAWAAVFHPFKPIVGIALSSGKIILWDYEAETVALWRDNVHKWGTTMLAFSPDGTLLATAGRDKKVLIRSLDTQNIVATFEYEKCVESLIFDGNNTIITSEGNQAITLSNISKKLALKRKCLYYEIDEKYYLGNVTYNKKRKLTAFSTHQGEIAIKYDLENLDDDSDDIDHSIQYNDEQINWVTLSPDGHYLAASSRDSNVYVWCAHTWKLIEILRMHHDRVYTAEFSPDGTQLVTASEDGKVCVWKHSYPVGDSEFSRALFQKKLLRPLKTSREKDLPFLISSLN